MQSIDAQIKSCREHYEAQAQLFELTQQTATLSLQQVGRSRFSSSSPSESFDPDFDSAPESVVAAMTFLGIQPSQALESDTQDLENALSLLDLRDSSAEAQLSSILRSIARR